MPSTEGGEAGQAAQGAFKPANGVGLPPAPLEGAPEAAAAFPFILEETTSSPRSEAESEGSSSVGTSTTISPHYDDKR